MQVHHRAYVEQEHTWSETQIVSNSLALQWENFCQLHRNFPGHREGWHDTISVCSTAPIPNMTFSWYFNFSIERVISLKENFPPSTVHQGGNKSLVPQKHCWENLKNYMLLTTAAIMERMWPMKLLVPDFLTEGLFPAIPLSARCPRYFLMRCWLIPSGNFSAVWQVSLLAFYPA